ncbi:MAG: S8 family peptidase [Gracilibacteraceae bacterium]|nr:S8 family peptidase [Gracilibacteraceae bacterium]
MPHEKHPIIANGELYVEPISRRTGPMAKKIPNEYPIAKQKMIRCIDQIFEQVQKQEEIFMDEKVICVRMEPKFEAKSYVPASIVSGDGNLEIIGGRKYRIDAMAESEEDTDAKLYFIKATDRGLRNLKTVLEKGSRDNVESWRKQIGSIRSMDFLSRDEKIMGFPDDWDSGTVEVVLHPMAGETDEMISLFRSTSKFPENRMIIRSYDDGPTFISAICSKDEVAKISALNPLRAIHPMGQVSIAPIRTLPSNSAPQAPDAKKKSKITVGVFDGGIAENVPLLSKYVTAVNCVSAPRDDDYAEHGTGVCGTVLYGNLAGRNSTDKLEIPPVSVEIYRVLPVKDTFDFELYEAIDAIEDVIKKRPDIKLFNLSFGPAGAIVDDSISRFTYVLDLLTYKVADGDINPLICVAVGNDGECDYPHNRIQSPSDMINGLSIGAYAYAADGSKTRASYSCVGEGREGAKIKPDILDFGGSIDRPFILVGAKPGTLSAAAGTSFASPFAAHKIGKLMARSDRIIPHIGRTLLIHTAQKCDTLTQVEQGFGFCLDDVDDIINCEDNKVIILYSGVLDSSQTVRLPVFAPKINDVKGNVVITWTVSTIVNPNVNDPDAYSCNCIEDVFVPHSMTYNFTKEGFSNKKLNLLKPDHNIQVKGLLDNGYTQSEFPVSHPAKKYWDETDLRALDLKWDAVIRKFVTMRGSSILNPALTLHAIGRNGYETEKIKYFSAITIEAPKYSGSLYDAILQNYQNLAPIEIRNINRLFVDIK